MQEKIYTIPVHEVFEKREGCPMCRMKTEIENRVLEYILGDAMMEPDVRIHTNEAGFCPEHLEKMMARRNRLQLSLMLETHLKSVYDRLFSQKLFASDSKRARTLHTLQKSCYVCERLERSLSQMNATVLLSYENDREFRELFAAQPLFCRGHYEELLQLSLNQAKKMPKYGSEFRKTLGCITESALKKLCEDVTKYCTMYDYRNNKPDKDWGDYREAVENALTFLK